MAQGKAKGIRRSRRPHAHRCTIAVPTWHPGACSTAVCVSQGACWLCSWVLCVVVVEVLVCWYRMCLIVCWCVGLVCFVCRLYASVGVLVSHLCVGLVCNHQTLVREQGSISFATYVSRVAAKAGEGGAGKAQQLEADLDRVDTLAITAATEITKEQAAAVDKKFKLCNNVGAGDMQARKDKKKVCVRCVETQHTKTRLVVFRRHAKPSGELRKRNCCKEGATSQQINCSVCLITQQSRSMAQQQHLQAFVQLAQQRGLLPDDVSQKSTCVHSMAQRLVEAERAASANTEQDAAAEASASYAPLLSDDALLQQVL